MSAASKTRGDGESLLMTPEVMRGVPYVALDLKTLRELPCPECDASRVLKLGRHAINCERAK